MATLDVIANAAARPGSPSDGDMYYQADLQQIVLYDGTATAWKVYTPDAAPYDLDGTNVLTVTPEFHYDASMINGTDATGNPSNNTALAVRWYSRAGGDVGTAVSPASAQFQYYSSGVNSKPYVDIPATADMVYQLGPISAHAFTGDFTFMFVAIKSGSDTGSNMAIPVEMAAGKLWFNFTSTGHDWLYGTTHGNLDRPSINLNNSGGGAAEMTYARTNGAGTTNDIARQLMITRSSGDTDLWVEGNNQNSSLGTTNTETGYIGDDVAGTNFTGAVLGGANASYRASDMHIYEYAAWQSNLSAADKNKIIAYVNTKYGSGTVHDGTAALARDTF